MSRRNNIVRVAIASSLLFGHLAVSSPLAGAARQSTLDGERLADQYATDFEPSGEAREHRHPVVHGLPDVDRRRDPATGEINALRASKAVARDASEAVAALKVSLPGHPDSLRVDLHRSGLAKQVVSLDGMLSVRDAGAPDQIARGFLERNAALFGLPADDVAALKVTMENYDESSGVTFLKYEQTVQGVTVFGSEMSIAISPQGEVVTATAGQLVDGVPALAAPAMSQEDAIAKAFEHCGAEISVEQLRASAAKSEAGLTKYANPLGGNRDDVLAEPSVVNLNGQARVAFHVYVDKGSSEWYETLVDATSGELIYRSSLYAHSFRGLVFTEHPDAGPQTFKQFVVDGIQFPNTPPKDAWLHTRVTTGNNVDAYIDRLPDNKPDNITRAGLSAGRALAKPNGLFDFPFVLGTGPISYRAASVTNLFYFNNLMHDRMYSLGFTESARNFQLDNFGRGGRPNDFVKAESQDGSGTNNANFATPPDGTTPRMQMFVFTRGTTTVGDDRDSSFDGDVVFHEYGHGVSNRLIGNGSGLTGIQSKAMGEGWSDYWAISAFDDKVMGEYVTNNPVNGIRRTPYDARNSAPNGNYSMIGVGGFQVHNDGEIWCQTLVDLRRRLGAARTDMIVLAGMKLTPVNPSMLNARDGILAANRALFGGLNDCELWEVFARHGMGFSATGNDGTVHNATFDVPRTCPTPQR